MEHCNCWCCIACAMRVDLQLMENRTPARTSALGRALASLAINGVLGGCVAAVGGGAVANGAMMTADHHRRGSTTRPSSCVPNAITAAHRHTRGNVSATSYNRVVLLTGQVPTDADRTQVEAAVTKAENVRAVVTGVSVGPNSSLAQQSTDT